MKRKLLTLLLACAAALALAAPAAADVIWEPQNSFYESHADQCEYEGRRYEAAGFDGSVTVWSAPNGAELETLPNGTAATVQFIWTGGAIRWGYLYGWSDDWEEGGWTPMDDLSPIYDSLQFMADHTDEIAKLDAPAPADFHKAVLYDYPNGPAGETLEEDAEYLPFSEAFTTVYTDGSGLRWGYVGYYMGRRNCWVCLDDPLNERLDTAVVETGPSPAQQRGSATEVTGLSRPLQFALAGALVLIAAAVTVVLIRRIRPKKQ